MDHIYILLLFGLVGLVRWLLSEGGLRKILTNLEDDLNQKKASPPSSRPEGLSRSQPQPRPGATIETAEQKRLRKFREALGIPADQPVTLPRSGRGSIPPVPPVVYQPARRPAVRKAELKSEPRREIPPQVPKSPAIPRARFPIPVEQMPDQSVESYFHMEKFDQPNIQVPSAQAPFAPVLSEENPAGDVSGLPFNLRRMILAREILGPPKSLQNT